MSCIMYAFVFASHMQMVAIEHGDLRAVVQPPISLLRSVYQPFHKEQEDLENIKVPGQQKDIYLPEPTLKKLRAIKCSYGLSSNDGVVQDVMNTCAPWRGKLLHSSAICIHN